MARQTAERLQEHVRTCSNQSRTSSEVQAEREEAAATKIQGLFRVKKAKEEAQRKKKEKENQRKAKEAKRNKEEAEEEAAATRIQAVYRGRCEREAVVKRENSRKSSMQK